MTKYARLTDAATNGDRVVIEVVEGDPTKLFHPDIAKDFLSVPNATVPGSIKNGQAWTHPEPVEPEPAPPPRLRTFLTPAEFRNAFTAFAAGAEGEADEQKKVLRKVVGVFFDRLRDPHLTGVDLADARNLAGLDLLVTAGLLTQARRDDIAAGLPA